MIIQNKVASFSDFLLLKRVLHPPLLIFSIILHGDILRTLDF